MNRSPRKGDAVVRVRASPNGVVLWHELGVVTDVSDGELRVRAFHVGTGAQLQWIATYYDTTPERWIGEWSGHNTAGGPCWCAPLVEHHPAGDVVIHNERHEP